MAHNRKINFERFYARMSIGQLLLLDENLLDYLKLTAPFGSGDEDDKPTRRPRTDARGKRSSVEPTIAEAKSALGNQMEAQQTTREAFTRGRPWLNDYIDDVEKGRDGRKRR